MEQWEFWGELGALGTQLAPKCCLSSFPSPKGPWGGGSIEAIGLSKRIPQIMEEALGACPLTSGWTQEAECVLSFSQKPW